MGRIKITSRLAGAAVVLLLVTATQASAAASPFRTQMSYGVEMAKRGLWAEALFRFQQAAKLDPQSGRALGNMAVAYEALGKFAEAKAAYESATRLDPRSPELKRNQGRFLEFFAGKPKGPATQPPAATPPAAPPSPVPPSGGVR